MSAEAFFHQASESVRFWVDVDDAWIGAMVSRQTLHYRYDPAALHDDPMVTFLAHRTAIESAVRSRFRGGSLEPVLLRETDLRPGPAPVRAD